MAFCFATAPHVASGRESSLENGIATFVTQAYFKAGYPSDIDPARIYTYIVDYWGKGILSRSRVLAEKRAHYKRWPIRKFTLNRETLRVSQMPSQPEFYLVEFRYIFDVSGQNGYRSGEAMTRLIVIKRRRYGFLVWALAAPENRGRGNTRRLTQFGMGARLQEPNSPSISLAQRKLVLCESSAQAMSRVATHSSTSGERHATPLAPTFTRLGNFPAFSSLSTC